MKLRTPLGTFVARSAECHPDRQHKGNGLCTTCYSRERARKHQTENRARSRAWYAQNAERSIAAQRRWLNENRGRHRETVLRYRYGLSPADEIALLESQGYACPICGDPFDGRSRATVASVDHDHATGKVRGLLHFRCNAGIGSLGDSPERLEAAARYLRGAVR